MGHSAADSVVVSTFAGTFGAGNPTLPMPALALRTAAFLVHKL